MPHANTFASSLKKLNCASGQANQTTLGNRPAVSASSARNISAQSSTGCVVALWGDLGSGQLGSKHRITL